MTTRPSSSGSRLAYLLPGVLLVAFLLSGVFDRDLWTPDEPRVAAIALEMSRTGDFVLPRLAGEPFVEEPPLYYAAAAIALNLSGLLGNTGAIRLTSVLWGIGTLVVFFLLARLFYQQRQALAGTLVLATMLGFIENTHWIRVDAALLFFVTASIWCFAETLIGGSRWAVAAAGAFMAAAFLVKGVVGPGMAAFGWLALFAARAWRLKWEGPAASRDGDGGDAGNTGSAWGKAFSGVGQLMIPHMVCAAIFAAVVGAWVLMFRSQAGPDLWHEWFWTNQVGRALGTAPQLGHLKQGHPFYYLGTILLYSLPWTPLIGVWAWRVARDLFTRRAIAPVNLFVLIWSCAILLVLTASATKRDLYLLPILPAFALMCAGILDAAIPWWSRAFMAAWCILCAVALVVCAYLPLLGCYQLMSLSEGLGLSIPENAAVFLTSWTSRHALAGLCFVVCLFLLLRARISGLLRTAVITAAAFIGLSAVAGRAVDIEKSLGHGVQSFAKRIDVQRRASVGGWGLSETMRGSFYYYCDWRIARIDDPQRLRDILSGSDKRFDSAIVSFEFGPADLGGIQVESLAETQIGPRGHERKLVWLRRAGPVGEK